MTASSETEAWDFGRGLSGYVWRAAAARANILLTHGFAEYAERYVERYHGLIPKLTALGFNVYAFDLEGHGRSAGPRGVTDLRRAVEDHLAARRALGADGKPLFLFGHSLGGLVTAASVAKDQENVAGVVLSAPALLISAPPHLRALAGLLSRIAPGLRVAPPLAADNLSRIPEEVEAYTSDPRVSDPRVPARTGATAIAISDEAWRLYPSWNAPTLVLHGEADKSTNPEGSRRFLSLIRSPDKRLELFPEGRHELLNDLDRDQALALITAWLSERASA